MRGRCFVGCVCASVNRGLRPLSGARWYRHASYSSLGDGFQILGRSAGCQGRTVCEIHRPSRQLQMKSLHDSRRLSRAVYPIQKQPSRPRTTPILQFSIAQWFHQARQNRERGCSKTRSEPQNRGFLRSENRGDFSTAPGELSLRLQQILPSSLRLWKWA